MATKKTYYEKLKDPRWQKKRLEVMEHNDFTCELCHDSEATLNVHHKEYFRDREPWEYKKEQLSCLCESCHEEQHKEVDILKLLCSYARLDGPENRTEIAMLIAGYMGVTRESLLQVNKYYDAPYLMEIYKSGQNAQKYRDKLSAKRIQKMRASGKGFD